MSPKQLNSTKGKSTVVKFVFEFNHGMKTIEFDERKVDRCHISIQTSTNISSHSRSQPFQGENDEALRGADGKDVQHPIIGSPGSSQLSGEYNSQRLDYQSHIKDALPIKPAKEASL